MGKDWLCRGVGTRVLLRPQDELVRLAGRFGIKGKGDIPAVKKGAKDVLEVYRNNAQSGLESSDPEVFGKLKDGEYLELRRR